MVAVVPAAAKAAEARTEGGASESVVKIVSVAVASPADTARGKEGVVLVAETRVMMQQATAKPPLVGTVWLVGVAAIALTVVGSACETIILLLERQYQQKLDV